MAYAVARMQKMKVGNLTIIENHNKRKTKNHTNKDIDVKKSHLNYDLVENSDTYHKNIMGYINENKTNKRAIRKDAVVVNEWLISASAAFFEGMEDDEIKRYFEVSKDFFANKFGEDNIRYAQVHMDVKTPQMHMGIVPFDDDMKLSSKRVVTRQTLIAIQDELPLYMQEHGFDVQRGEKESQRNHLSVPEYKDAKEKAKELEVNNQSIYDKIYDEAVKNARQVYLDQKLEDEKAEATTITIRVDKDLKEDAAELFEGLGMNTSTAINAFLRQSVRENKVPFEIKRNMETENALREVQEGNLETSETFDEFWEDLNEDK